MSLSEIQIDGGALVHNVRALRSLVGRNVQVAAVVKGNAYGHGLEPVVSALEGTVDCFQVDDIEELRALRRLTKTRALVLGYVAKRDMEEALGLGAEFGVFDLGQVLDLGKAAERAGVKARVHLKIDALLGRLGVLPDGLAPVLDALRSVRSIEVVAAYAHFANIEDTTDLEHAYNQASVFDEAYRTLKQAWPGVGRHMSSTAGAMTMEGPASSNDLVRLGIGVYGLYPSGALSRAHTELGLRPALRWVSHLAQVKLLPPKHPVGYGLTYRTSRATLIGIVPQGYSDGYDRGLSSAAEVLVRGKRCPAIGRVAMNMFAVDLSAVPDAQREDEVVLLGAQGDERISAEELASLLGTINYEITTRLSSLLPRSLVGAGLDG